MATSGEVMQGWEYLAVSGVSYGNVGREDSEIVMVSPMTGCYCPPGCV